LALVGETEPHGEFPCTGIVVVDDVAARAFATSVAKLTVFGAQCEPKGE